MSAQLSSPRALHTQLTVCGTRLQYTDACFARTVFDIEIRFFVTYPWPGNLARQTSQDFPEIYTELI